MWGRHFANLLIGMFTLWAIFVVVAWLLGVLIMFPFVEVETDEEGTARKPVWSLLMFEHKTEGQG